jgi:hypothetical protein
MKGEIQMSLQGIFDPVVLAYFKKKYGSATVEIIVADTVEVLPDPSTVPEGTIAIVTSEG